LIVTVSESGVANAALLGLLKATLKSTLPPPLRA
jgi:hypothetical protein